MKTTLVMEIEAERDRQDKQWGGPSHDDAHAFANWTFYIEKQAVKTRRQQTRFRERMVKVAALAVAAIESYDRLMAPP